MVLSAALACRLCISWTKLNLESKYLGTRPINHLATIKQQYLYLIESGDRSTAVFHEYRRYPHAYYSDEL